MADSANTEERGFFGSLVHTPVAILHDKPKALGTWVGDKIGKGVVRFGIDPLRPHLGLDDAHFSFERGPKTLTLLESPFVKESPLVNRVRARNQAAIHTTEAPQAGTNQAEGGESSTDAKKPKSPLERARMGDTVIGNDGQVLGRVVRGPKGTPIVQRNGERVPIEENTNFTTVREGTKILDEKDKPIGRAALNKAGTHIHLVDVKTGKHLENAALRVENNALMHGTEKVAAEAGRTLLGKVLAFGKGLIGFPGMVAMESYGEFGKIANAEDKGQQIAVSTFAVGGRIAGYLAGDAAATAAGAAIGASIGSVVPILGTVIGGVVGAVAGFVVGLAGGTVGSMIGGSVAEGVGKFIFGDPKQKPDPQATGTSEHVPQDPTTVDYSDPMDTVRKGTEYCKMLDEIANSTPSALARSLSVPGGTTTLPASGLPQYSQRNSTYNPLTAY